MEELMMKKFVLAVSVVVFLLAMQPAEAAFPERPIIILNSSSAGSPSDLMARQIALNAEAHIAQPLVVENRTGGAGAVMFAALLAEPTDGYTIASSNASQIATLQSQLRDQFSFDDFDFLANVQLDYFCFVVMADSPYHTINDVVEAVKGGESLLFGGQGTGSTIHLTALRLARLADIDITWLPLQGGADAAVNLLGGHVDIIVTSPITVWQNVEAGQMRILALSSPERTSILPEIPTLREHGFDVVMSQYRGFIARKGIPREIKEKIVEAIRNAANEPGFQEFLVQTKIEFGYMELDEFARFARADFDKMAEYASLLDN
jgi:tripartite-type tricarboxylate transporter receptor subunit TctC